MLQAVARPKRRRIPGGRRYDVTGEEAGERGCREHGPAVAFASRKGPLDGVTSAASESGALAACERWILMEDAQWRTWPCRRSLTLRSPRPSALRIPPRRHSKPTDCLGFGRRRRTAWH